MDLCGDRTVLNLDCSVDSIHLHVCYNYLELHTDTNSCIQRSTWETGEIWMRSVDCANIIFLVLILYYSYLRWYHWGKLSEGTWVPLCAIFVTSCDSIIILKWKLKKKRIILLHVITWMDIKNIILMRKIPSQTFIYYIIPLIQGCVLMVGENVTRGHRNLTLNFP